MFGSSFSSSLPASGGSASGAATKSLFPVSDFSGVTSNNNKTNGPSLPFAGFGGASVQPKPSSTAANKPSESGGFNFGGNASSTKSSAGVGDEISSAKSNLFASTDTTNKSPPTTSSSNSLPISGFCVTKSTSSSTKTNTSSFAGAASKAAASASKNSTHHVSSSALVPTSSSTALTTTNNNNNTSSISNYNNSLENSCISPNGRSFHSYLYDTTLQKHVIVSEFAPFGDTISSGGDNVTPRDNNDNGGISSSLKVTTVLPILVQESIAIDNVIGLLCVNGNNDNDRSKQSLFKQQQQGEEGMKTLPTLCLYTSTSVFLLTIGYIPPDEGDDQKSIQGKILQSHEPFEKQLLMSPSNSSIIRIRSAPQSNSMFSRNGSIAMLLREGGKDDTFVGYIVCLYHGLPVDGSQSGKVGGEVTTPLRFNYQDLVRGLQDTVDAENAAYNRGAGFDQPSPSSSRGKSTPSKSVVDFCFNSNSSAFSSTSILVLCNDGTIYGASPIIFDGAVLPRTTVVNTISQLNDEIEASSSYLQAMSQTTPAPTTEHEGVEARLRQCRAARRYLLDVFGIPEGMVTGTSNSASGGSYYVSASVVHTKSYSSSGDNDGGYSQALSWQPRLQGPLGIPPEEQSSGSYSCIESFGGTSSASIIDGFVVARTCNSQTNVEVGILPGEGAVILPRFEFESDADCQLIDDIVRATGMYVESASIMNDVSEEESGESTSSTALTTISSNSVRDCSIVVDPLDDIMLHLVTKSRIVTVTTNAVAVTANCFKSRADGTRGEDKGLSTIRTKVWSELEVSLTNTALVGACVSGDVHLGHIMLARVSNGSMEVVNITATQCLYETSEQMKAKSEELEASVGDDAALEVLKKVKPLHEILQPLIDKVCNGLSKMGKIVGGSTLPKDAGPENLATFLETQHSCEVNVLMPLEEMSKILSARRELLTEMYNHQSVELVRLTALLDEFKSKYESNLKRVVALESKAAILTERSSAVLTATRELRPTITDAEAAYFKDLQRYETSCNKWESTVSRLEKESTTSCEAMSAGAIENGDVRCLVDLPPQKIDVCHKLLGGEAQILKKLETKVKEASDNVEQLSKVISGLGSEDAARLRLVGGDKENQRS